MKARDELVWESIGAARAEVEGALPSYLPWLLACVGGPDNASTKYKGLIGLMRDAGVVVSTPAVAEMQLRKDDGGRYFYGVFGPLVGDLGFLRGFITPSSMSFLAFFPEGVRPDVSALVSTGWWRGVSDLLELRDVGLQVVGQEGVLLRPFGLFDDRDVGVDILTGRRQFDALSRGAEVGE